jgi:TonB family protein
MIPFLLLALNCMGQEPKAVTQVEILEHLIKGPTSNAPVYPPLARQARIQGTVELTLFINESGDVTDVRMEMGHPMLQGAAVDAAKRWKFSPFIENDEAVAVSAPVTIKFHLDGTDSLEEAAFKKDFESKLRLARESFEKGTISASRGAESAEQSLKLARDARHSFETAEAQLLIAQLSALQGLPATEDFETALKSFRQAISNGQISALNAEWTKANLFAGSYFFRSKEFVRAEPLLEQALQILLADPNASDETRAQIARTASVLAITNLELKRTQAAEFDCKIFKREKRALHGLELDEASQACTWMH